MGGFGHRALLAGGLVCALLGVGWWRAPAVARGAVRAVAPAAGAGSAVEGAQLGADLLGIGFQLVNDNSGKCLTVVGEALGDHAGLIQRTCSREPAYRWRLVPVSLGGSFRIENVKSGKCLTVGGAGLADNDFAEQVTCDPEAARTWQVRQPGAMPGGLPVADAQLVNARSNKCLTIAGEAAVENAIVVQYTCDDSRSRRWSVRLVAGLILADTGT